MTKHNNTGGLWRNKYKEAGDKKPDFMGDITIEGVTYKIAGWHNSGEGGKPVIALKVTPEVKPPTPAKPVNLSGVSDTDLPF